MSIRQLVILNAIDLFDRKSNELTKYMTSDEFKSLSGSEMFNYYYNHISREDGWVESLEISLLAKIKNLQILIFRDLDKKTLILSDIFGTGD